MGKWENTVAHPVCIYTGYWFVSCVHHTNNINVLEKKNIYIIVKSYVLFYFRQIYHKYDEQYPMSEWRFELRVRYSPDDMEDLYERDRFTYFFYYDQVRMFSSERASNMKYKIRNKYIILYKSSYNIRHCENCYDIYHIK